VSALCDEVVVIAQGVVLEHGTPEQIRARTAASSLEEAFVRLIGATDR
jgi:sodium transport system ATP-binding protein